MVRLLTALVLLCWLAIPALAAKSAAKIDAAAINNAEYRERPAADDRIDPAIVKREVEAAGFKFVGENNALRNPADARTVGVFDASIRGKTDQFVYKFQKRK